MFEVEMRLIQSDSGDVEQLAEAFHRDVVIHEPASLPYAGDWRGLEQLAALFRKMREVWSDMSFDQLEAARDGDTVFMRCTLSMTCRANGARIVQPFAEVLHFDNDLLVDGTPFYFDTAEIVAALER
ncbi:nuclear transport factor 2 family protein [Mesorhizobium sp. ZC-5]|uniref:nuclear transport factor 2 family protein n=1 Tax=Mesorhizobium sp. ZC-5 TaxID=2986066 RepID=UPI0021E6E6FA|nr:nuclear transport factor 2 family protein [Mesorhizobium sp. ZC-5]MCV3240563.1 nuclear transport factor 2 family protein [Mesorhizobium sp. ZC-5]